MIQSIYQIGRAVMEGSSDKHAFLESLAQRAPTATKDAIPKIAILKLDTKQARLDIEVRELAETGENTVERFLWLGNASSASKQDRLTTDRLEYLVSQTLPNLISLLRVDTPLFVKLTEVIDKYFIDIGASYRRARQLLSLEKFGIEGPTLDELQESARKKGDAKDLPNSVADALRKHFKQHIGNEKMLFTLEIDGKLVVDDNEYIAYLEDSYIGNIFKKAENGRCYLSGEFKPVTPDLTKLKFKYYIKQKQGFASGVVSEGFRSNYVISKDAYKALLAGERFVERELDFFMADTRGYILPNYLHIEMSTKTLDDILVETRSVKKRTEINLGIQERLDEIIEYEAGEQNYSLNLLFYKRAQASFKVIRLIEDVPEYRLAELRRAGVHIKTELGDRLFGENKLWELTLKKMYYLLPVLMTKENNKPVYHTRGVLEFYHTLIIGGLIDKRQLVKGFMELVRAYRFGNYDAYHISQRDGWSEDRLLITYVAQSVLLLAFLRLQNQLKEENLSMDYLNDLSVNNKQRMFLEQLHYSKNQTALYLVGSLIAEIANSQYRLSSDGKGGKKTILNKLNYQGMTLSKVRKLVVDLFDKLRQYRDSNRQSLLNARNEKIFAQAQMLLSEGENGWDLTPSENVYYILSGYSHSTLQAISSGSSQRIGDTADNSNSKGEQI